MLLPSPLRAPQTHPIATTGPLRERAASWMASVGATVGLAILLPLVALTATPASLLPPHIITGFLSFGLIALLYLVTEELLVEAHEQSDLP